MQIYLEKVRRWFMTTTLGVFWVFSVVLMAITFLINQIPIDPTSRMAVAYGYVVATTASIVMVSILGSIFSIMVASIRFIKKTTRRQLMFVGLCLLAFIVVFLSRR